MMKFRKIRDGFRRWVMMGDLAEYQRRLTTLLENQAAEKAGYYVGYDRYPGELHADIQTYRDRIAELRNKLGLPAFVEPQYYMQPLP